MSLLLTVKLGDCKAKMDGLSLFSATYLLCFLILFLYSSLAWACCRLKHYVRRRQLFTHPKQASQAAPSQGRRGRLSLPTSLPPPPQKIGKLESPPSITSLKMYCAPSLPPLSRTNLPSPRDSCLGIRRRRWGWGWWGAGWAPWACAGKASRWRRCKPHRGRSTALQLKKRKRTFFAMTAEAYTLPGYDGKQGHTLSNYLRAVAESNKRNMKWW